MTSLNSLVYDFPVVAEKMDDVVTLTKMYITYFKDRAALENVYGKGINYQGSAPVKSGIFHSRSNPIEKTDPSLKEVLNKLNEHSINIGRAHLNTSALITNEIIKPMEVMVKNLETGKKKLVRDALKEINYHKAQSASAAKLNANYLKMMTEYRASVELETVLTGQQKQKQHTRVVRNAAKVKKIRSDLKACLDKVENLRVEIYEFKIPQILKICNQLISNHYDSFKEAVSCYIASCGDLCKIRVEAVEAMNKCIENLSFPKDLEMFATHNCKMTPIETISMVFTDDLPDDLKETADKEEVIDLKTKEEKDMKDKDEKVNMEKAQLVFEESLSQADMDEEFAFIALRRMIGGEEVCLECPQKEKSKEDVKEIIKDIMKEPSNVVETKMDDKDEPKYSDEEAY
ncbi:hypothetical protein EIN_197350 [Entamoeba invadens IP1]|uniref:F-BAR domain-containing protein n=1 Tax=Entamoeba invadens IP1 TaxID=370355 RepID=A0A0A1TUP4_ENTIV|nr:hypothetical protein EIN_197350 [Entamoeba invadens IP1]ELP83822.1 hypothetical protein EIN_197350 [Entamoeba invadens IP1]|eukprot:XP_004183168.1 hypothetical protein EIN_197350 [Entamoeba invadens IP1]